VRGETPPDEMAATHGRTEIMRETASAARANLDL